LRFSPFIIIDNPAGKRPEVEAGIFFILIGTMNGVHSGWNLLETTRWQFAAWPHNRTKSPSSGDCPKRAGCALLNRLAKTSEPAGNSSQRKFNLKQLSLHHGLQERDTKTEERGPPDSMQPKHLSLNDSGSK